jgi:hypothetical protein
MKKYPHNWLKVSLRLRLNVRHCELCLLSYPVRQLSVHHIGTPYPDGRPGDPGDKHDLRRHNLLVVCSWCHRVLDEQPSQQPEHIRLKRAKQRHKKSARRQAEMRARFENHRALGIGTGLVPVEVSRCN